MLVGSWQMLLAPLLFQTQTQERCYCISITIMMSMSAVGHFSRFATESAARPKLWRCALGAPAWNTSKLQRCTFYRALSQPNLKLSDKWLSVIRGVTWQALR